MQLVSAIEWIQCSYEELDHYMFRNLIQKLIFFYLFVCYFLSGKVDVWCTVMQSASATLATRFGIWKHKNDSTWKNKNTKNFCPGTFLSDALLMLYTEDHFLSFTNTLKFAPSTTQWNSSLCKSGWVTMNHSFKVTAVRRDRRGGHTLNRPAPHTTTLFLLGFCFLPRGTFLYVETIFLIKILIF